MNADLNINFRLNNQKYEVNLIQGGADKKSAVTIGGISYSVHGQAKGKALVKTCLDCLPEKTELLQTGKELKARLWLAGAKEVTFSSVGSAHQVALQALGSVEPLDVHQTVEDLCEALEKHYIFPEIAKKCSNYLRQQLREGSYEPITDLGTFSQVITSDIRKISNDKHIRFYIDSPEFKETATEGENGLGPYPLPSLEKEKEWIHPETQGWPYELKAGFLESNPDIGYLDFRVFGAYKTDRQEEKKYVEGRKEAYIDLVNHLQEAKAIIVDLRNNGGGDPPTVELFSSLFLPEGLPLNAIEIRQGDIFTLKESNSFSYTELPKEKRLLEQKVILLIGPETFSAAEAFANDLKVLGRATIVGEISGGGANPGDPPHDIGDFKAFIPYGRAINPIQQGNWEGVGIIPDHMVPAEKALDVAVEEMIKHS